MSQTCWRCAARVRSGNAFCRDCGAALEARIEVAPETVPRADRRSRLLALLAVALVGTGLLWLMGNPQQEGESPVPAADPATSTRMAAPGDVRFAALERETGTTLVVLGKTQLATIDLDSNRRTTLRFGDEILAGTASAGRRLLVQGQTLLVPNGQATWAIDLATGQIKEDGPGDRVAPATTPGNAWILTELSGTWREIDDAGRVIREIEWPDAGLPWDHGAGTPELTAAPGGGIYRLQEDGEWLRVSEGVPLAGNNSLALVQDCESLERCKINLIDLESGEELSDRLPALLEEAAGRRFRMSPSGAGILEMNPTGRSWESVFSYSEGVVRATSCMQGWRQATWSPDETLIACVTNRGVAVTDVAYGTAAIFDDLDEEPLAVVLVDSDVVGIGG